MEIKEVKQAKKELEMEIVAILKQFEAKTNTIIESVNVNCTDIGYIEGHAKRIISGVELEVKIP